jgi:hypothetical protein
MAYPRLFAELDSQPYIDWEHGSSYVPEPVSCVACGEVVPSPTWHVYPETLEYACQNGD